MTQRKILGWLLWGAVMVGLGFHPVYNFFKENHENLNKDYDIWYEAGRAVCEGRDLYVPNESLQFNFMYPPAAAVLLAPLTVAGKLPFIVILELLNSTAWALSVWLGLRVATGRGWNNPKPLITVPILLCLPYVWDTYHLGQPNLQLLACLLGATLCLQRRYQAGAGILIALATAIKAFPVLTSCYLIYRRYWVAVVALLGGLFLWLLIIPSTVRGWDRNWSELQTWSNAMLRTDARAIGQRTDISYRWKNQSLLATTHRLLRHVHADQLRPFPEATWKEEIPLYVNVANLDVEVANRIAFGLMAAWGLIYVALMPSAKLRTTRTDSLEFGMLLVMITVCSPISWFYYGVWLLFPFLLVVQEFLNAAPGSRKRPIIIVWTGAAVLLLDFVPPWGWYRSIRAVGTPFFGYVLLFGELGWFLRQEIRQESRSVPSFSERPDFPSAIP